MNPYLCLNTPPISVDVLNVDDSPVDVNGLTNESVIKRIIYVK